MSFTINLVLQSMFMLGTIFSWGCESSLPWALLAATGRLLSHSTPQSLVIRHSHPVLTILGRRTLYTCGVGFMSFMRFIIGGMAFIGTQQSTLAIGAILVAVNFVYNCTLGPLCYTIIAETPSTRLRAKSIALARVSYQVRLRSI
jgi:SP family general alpha glucoside:H+ symporter-like MFS transporter